MWSPYSTPDLSTILYAYHTFKEFTNNKEQPQHNTYWAARVPGSRTNMITFILQKFIVEQGR